MEKIDWRERNQIPSGSQCMLDPGSLVAAILSRSPASSYFAKAVLLGVTIALLCFQYLTSKARSAHILIKAAYIHTKTFRELPIRSDDVRCFQ